MRLSWTIKALADLARLHAFLVPVNPRAAAAVVQRLAAAPQLLLTQPKIGTPMPEIAARDARRLIVGDYETRYELAGDVALVVRLWPTREIR